MKISLLSRVASLLFATTILTSAPAGASAWDDVAAILQAPDSFAGGVHRFNLPRRDLSLHVGNVTLAPELAQGGWVGLSDDPDDAMAMGDLVLTGDELGPVLTELDRHGLAVTAVHNHLVREEPKLVYVHFGGRGKPLELARSIDAVLARTATPRPVAVAATLPLAIDTSLVFRTLGRSGRAHGNVAQVSFTLVPGTVTMAGMPVPPALGLASPISIQAVDASRALATGDFAVPAAKVSPMLHAFAKHGITVTALHTHMVGEVPTIYFMHFWADGPTQNVLEGLRAVIDAAK